MNNITWIFERDLWREIYTSLTKNIVRTILTTLGVVIAIMILILLLGTTNGMKNGFNNLFKGTATNSLFVWGGSTEKPYKGFRRNRRVSYTLNDVTLLKNKVSEIETISPRIRLSNSKVSRNGQSSESVVYGDFPKIDEISKKLLIEGRFINHNDINNQRKICVIGSETYERLYKKNEDVIGSYLQINGIYFQIVGVTKKKGKADFDSQNIVMIPFTTYQKSFNSGNRISYMAIAIEPSVVASDVLKKIKKILKKKHNIHPEDEQAIGSFDLSEVFSQISTFTLALGGFSFFMGIFTLLGGIIAISNILLITVKERRKEIGIRRALGATPIVIKRQIILEALVLTILSALIGFAISIGILFIVDTVMSNNNSNADIPFENPTVSFLQLIISFLIMITLSLLIGLIPANRAIKIKPIEALSD